MRKIFFFDFFWLTGDARVIIIVMLCAVENHKPRFETETGGREPEPRWGETPVPKSIEEQLVII